MRENPRPERESAPATRAKTPTTAAMTPNEKEQLKSYENLLAYCEHTLGTGKRSGSEWLFMCPHGAHARPHLAIAAKDGQGVYRCRACNIGGDIFTLAAHLNGLDAKKDFAAVAQCIADTLHISLTDAGGQPQRAPKRSRRRRIPPQILTTTTPQARFISAGNEAFLWQAIEQSTAERLQDQAAALGLPAKGLAYIARHPEQGGLALAPDGRLLVIYTAEDEAGKLRITACKLRNRKDAQNMPAYLHGGQWMPGNRPTEARFMWIAQNGTEPAAKNGEQPRRLYAPSAPYGMQAAHAASRIIITEGESDAWAARISLAHYAHLAGYKPLDYAAVIAVPGVSSFKIDWMPYFAGKSILLCLDADEAGQKALPQVLQKFRLYRARVHVYTPANGKKDLRAEFCTYAPAALAARLLEQFKSPPATTL